jgi:hypothetical protein
MSGSSSGDAQGEGNGFRFHGFAFVYCFVLFCLRKAAEAPRLHRGDRSGPPDGSEFVKKCFPHLAAF